MTEVGSVSVRVSADTASFQTGMAGVEGRLQSFSRSVGSIGSALTVGLTVPLAAAAAGAISVFSDFESSLNTLQAVTGAFSDEMEFASRKAIELGADLTLPATSAKDAAIAMTELAKGGMDLEEAMDAAKGTLQLAAAAEIDVKDAATISARALNTFGLEASEAGRVADLLAASANASSGEITDMADALQMSGSVAAAAGIPIEDLVTAISEMANAGIVGSDAGTSLKQMLLSLQAPTEKSAGLMKDLGIQIYDAQGNMLPMRGIIAELEDGLGGLTQEQRNAALATIFGSDAVRAANVLLAEGVKGWDEMKDAVTRGGAAQELAAAKTKGLKGAFEGLKSQIETLAIQFGQRLAPAIESVTRFLAGLAQRFGELSPKAQSVVMAIAGIAAAVGPVLMVVSRLAPALALVASPIGLIVAAVAALAAGFAYLYTQSESFRAFVQGLIPALQQLWQAVQDLAVALKDALTAAFQALQPIIEPILAAIQGSFSGWLTALTGLVQTFAALLQGDWSGAWNGIKTIASGLWEAMKAQWSGILGAMQAAASSAWTAIQGAASSAWAAIKGALSSIWEAIKSTFGTVMEALKSKAQAVWNEIKGLAESIWNGIKDAIQTAIESAKSIVTTALNAIKNTAQTVWNTVKSLFQRAIGPIQAAASAIAAAFGPIISGLMAIVSAAQSAISWLQSLGSVSVNADVSGITGSIGTVNGKAAGGPVRRGNPYVVGEQGPELWVPDSNGTIIPNHEMGRAGGFGMAPVNVQVFIDGRQVAAAVRTEFARTGYRNPTVLTAGVVTA